VRLPDVDRLGRPVSARRRLVAAGVSHYRIRTAVAGGRWQEALPGVVVGHTGPLTLVERWQAALEYAGEAAVLSHRSALLAHRARIEECGTTARPAGVRGEYRLPPEGGLVEVTVPHSLHLPSTGFVVVHQSRRPVVPVLVHGLPVALPARAAVDVAVTSPRRGDVDHVVADVLQKGLCTVADLALEAELLGRRCTPALRAAVADVGVGVRSVGEAELRRVVRLAGVPEPEWGALVPTAEGPRYVDALWRRRRLAAEADGAAFHLSAEDWQRDLHRQNLIMAADLRLLRFTVSRMRRERPRCAAELAAAHGLRSAAGEVP
jgi:hypothetical protein